VETNGFALGKLHGCLPGKFVAGDCYPMPSLETSAVEFHQQNALDDFNSYSKSQRQRIHNQIRKKTEDEAGEEQVIRWKGPLILSSVRKSSVNNQLDQDVRKILETNMNKKQAQKLTTTGEKPQQLLKSDLRFNPQVYPLEKFGACMVLTEKMQLVSQLFTGVSWWRLQFDTAGSGITTVAVSPITLNTTQDLSPMNLFQVATWLGAEKVGLDRYMEVSNLKVDIEKLVETYGNLVIISDWQGLRILTKAQSPASRNMDHCCCHFCDQKKGDMKQLKDPEGTTVQQNDLLREVLTEPTHRVPCVFHGLRVLVSWCWLWSVKAVKEFGSRTATSSLKVINEKLNMSWDESKYLPFEVFEKLVTERVYMLLFEPVLDEGKVVVLCNERVRVVDLLLQLWDCVAIILQNTFTNEPNVQAFKDACERVVLIARKLGWVATVWPHCVLFHFKDFLDELGSLAPLDNRSLERFHPEATNSAKHCQHGRVTGGRTGWEHCLGQDNQKLHYALQDAFHK